jgi:CPA1 family monovalent cation:H+ antiporter
MTIPLVMQYVLTVSLVAFGGLVLRRLFRLDISLASLFSGLIASLAVPFFGLDTGIRAANVHDLVFYIVLPLLIFISAWHIDMRLFRRWFGVCFTLATLGVLLAAGITATGIYYAIAHPVGFPWIAAFLASSILAATDPVSVSAQLKSSKASEDLRTLFEGESLLNDASVVVLYGILMTYALGQQPEHNAVMAFATILFGGAILGALIGMVAAIFTLYVRDRSASILVMIITAFGAFYIAEALLHLSGIMAVMAAAISTRALLREHEHELLSEMSGTFDWLDLFLNTVIFSLLGLLMTWEMLRDQWLAIIIGIVCALIARFATLFLLAAATRKSRKVISWKWALLLSWGGLKGAIAIVLVLSLPVELDYWWTIQAMVFGVVFFSLVVQGGTFPWLVEKVISKKSP